MVAAATVFLETSLGTRLVVSFPAATTVADLKRRVTAEHAACFPETGAIAVKSLQVKHDGSLFHLTDSMAVEAAFRWVINGPWNLLVEACPLARGDAGCGSGGGASEQNAGGAPGVGDAPLLNQVDGDREDTIKHDSDQLEDLEKHALGLRKSGILKAPFLQECSGPYLTSGSSDNPIDLELDDTPCEGVSHVLGQPENGTSVKTMLQEGSEGLNLAAGESEPRAKSQMDKSPEDVEHASSRYEDGNAKATLEESSDSDVAADDGETSSMNQHDKSHQGVNHASGQHGNGDVLESMIQENSGLGVAAGEGEIPPMDQLDKSHENVKHGSRQCEDGNVETVPEESSEFDVAATETETLPMNQMDKARKDASEQREDGTVDIISKKSSDFDESGAAKDLPVQGQQKDVTAEPRGKELSRKVDKNDGSTIANCDENIFSLSSPTVNIDLAQEKSGRIGQENLNSNPLPYEQGSCSHVMEEKTSHGQKKPWTSGESSNNGSDTPPCVPSMGRDNSSIRGDEEEQEPWVAGLCSGESSFKDTDVPHCIKSTEEGNKRPASNDQFINKRKYECATSTTSTEHQPCFKKRQQRVVIMRKVPMSRAAKIYGLRC